METLGEEISSIRYKISNEGNAIKRRINIGTIVQIVSKECESIVRVSEKGEKET
jgi:vacuolar-type H+-ATPase subunit H